MVYIKITGVTMRLKNLYLIILFVFSLPAHSEPLKVYTLSEGVTIRQQPSSKSKIVATLPVASELSLVSATSGDKLLRGYKAQWLKVSFTSEGMSKKGYVWQSLTTKDIVYNDETIFLFGIQSIKSQYVVYYQVVAVADNSEISRISFKGIGSLGTCHSLSIGDNRNIEDLESILTINFRDERCSKDFGDIILFWNGKSLYLTATLETELANPDVDETTLIYPTDKGGKKNSVIFKRFVEVPFVEETKGSEKGKVHKEEQLEEFLWNGQRLVKSK
jgi:hypothetical protein